jgi:hypothetical protein
MLSLPSPFESFKKIPFKPLLDFNIFLTGYAAFLITQKRNLAEPIVMIVNLGFVNDVMVLVNLMQATVSINLLSKRDLKQIAPFN